MSIRSQASSLAESIYEPDEIGTLIIIISKAKNLSNKRAISKQNPYCSIRIGQHAARTPTKVRGGQTPDWDHEARFKLTNQDCLHQLKLSVFDQYGNNTEIIGDATIPIKPALESSRKKGYDSWYTIRYNTKYVGEVYLEMTFYPRFKSFRKKSQEKTLSPAHSLRVSRPSRPLPKPPTSSEFDEIVETDIYKPDFNSLVNLQNSTHSQQSVPVSQEDISRQINNGYEESLFERLKPQM